MFEEAPGVVHHGNLAAGADARVERQHGEQAGGRGEQQVLQVLAEDLDGLFVGAVFQFQPHFRLDGGIEQPVVGIFDGLFQVRRPLAQRAHHLRPQPRQRLHRVHLDFEDEDALLGAAPYGQHAMRGNLAGRFAELRVQLVFAFWVGNAFDGAACHQPLGHHHAAHLLAEGGIFADPLGDNVARALHRFVRGRHALFRAHEGSRKIGQGCRASLVPEVLRQRFQALVAGDGRLGAPLRLVGQVQVFQFGLFERRLDARLQFRGQLALFGDGVEHGFPALFELAEILQLFLNVADLDFVQVAGGLFAVTRDERHRGACVEQFDDGVHALQGDLDFAGDMDEDGGRKCDEFSHEFGSLP